MLSVGYDYLKQLVCLCWQDVEYGLQHGYIAVDVAVRFCSDELEMGRHLSHELENMFLTTDALEIVASVKILADSERPIHPDDLRRKWHYVILSWLYDHRQECRDPLGQVESVYADFGYPSQIASFVRYMPMQGPDLGSEEKNEKRLMSRWYEYLLNEKQVFTVSPH